MRATGIEKRQFITDHIRKFGPVSRHVITRRFGMNQASVGNIVEGLINDGIVIEMRVPRPANSKAGRPPIALKLNPDAGRFIGIDMYDRRITAVLTDFECYPLAEHRTSFRKNATPATIVKDAQKAITTLLEKENTDSPLKGIGLGLPGSINLRNGTAASYHRLPNWNNIPFAASLTDDFKVPVFVDHNSSTVALCEAWKNHRDSTGVLASILVRTGISVGLVQNREIINHSTYSAGELGHTIINFDGPECWCGRKGCLETYASGTALARQVEQQAQATPDWPGAEAIKTPQVDADHICRLAMDGDKDSLQILRELFKYLCIGIDTVASLHAPDIITVNGIFNLAEPLLRDAIDQYCHGVRPETVISINPYNDRQGAIGAALLTASRIYNPVHQLPV